MLANVRLRTVYRNDPNSKIVINVAGTDFSRAFTVQIERDHYYAFNPNAHADFVRTPIRSPNNQSVLIRRARPKRDRLTEP